MTTIVKIRTLALVGALCLLAPIVIVLSGVTMTGSVTPPPQLPSNLAPYASVLQANRGGATPLSVDELGARASTPGMVKVADSAGSYLASLKAGGPFGSSTLTQTDQGSNRMTLWLVKDGKVVDGPHQTTYTSTKITLGPGSPTSPPPIPGPTVTPTQPPGPLPPGALGRPHQAHLTSLVRSDVLLLINNCQINAGTPVDGWYYIYFILGTTEGVCDYPTSMILGGSIDQVGWDYHWHQVGQPGSGGGTSRVESINVVQKCLNYGTDDYEYRTRSWGLLEWNSPSSGPLYGSGENNSLTVEFPCSDGPLWTATLSS